MRGILAIYMLFLQTYDKLSVWKVWNFSENLQTTIQHNQYHRVAITVITNTVPSKKVASTIFVQEISLTKSFQVSRAL